MSGHLLWYDWAIIWGYILFAMGLGIWHSKKSLSSMDEYFASGKDTPWWILGTSIVATTFAADTPLAISGLVVKQGIWGNWYWWNGALAGMIALFFISRLWHRANVLTDTELVELRYSGKPAAVLRGFRAIYFSIPYNCLVMGWVNLAMAKIIMVVLNLQPYHPVMIGDTTWIINTKMASIIFCFVLTLTYTALAGLTGVMLTDFIQFILAMAGSIYLATVALHDIGGISNVLNSIRTIYTAQKASEITSIFPPLSWNGFSSALSGAFGAFMIYIGLQWWTCGNTDGGGYAAQRLISAKNEKHAFLGYLWYNIAHFCLRPWPWIIVGLCAAVLFPYIPGADGVLPDPEKGYIKVMMKYLPNGLLGLMLASFLAAYMSTVDTQMNWGASYLTNDLYKRFIKKNASEKHYIKVSLWATVLICLIASIFTYLLDSIVGAWQLLTAVFSGIGLVYLLRWLWWRVNAWSELTAIATSFILACLQKFMGSQFFQETLFTSAVQQSLPAWFVKSINGYAALSFPFNLLVLVPVCSLVWITVTFLTKPVDEDQLIAFYRRVRPPGPGWKHIAAKCPDVPKPEHMKETWQNYLIGIIAVYSALIGMGYLIFTKYLTGLILLMITLGCGVLLWKRLSTQKWE
jgi:Na+/proline symporter